MGLSFHKRGYDRLITGTVKGHSCKTMLDNFTWNSAFEVTFFLFLPPQGKKPSTWDDLVLQLFC